MRKKQYDLYKVKEIYYTLQGEGYHTGRPAVFLRFSGCNLWSGREEDREDAICTFCDTDFRGTDGPMGGKYTAEQLAGTIAEMWPDASQSAPYIVCTGGEPILQLDDELVKAFHKKGFEVAVETNGTLELPNGIDWVCVSPKAGAPPKVREGDELKLVYPQREIQPEEVDDWDFANFFIQPMDGPELEENTRKAVEFCKLNPKWRLSVQTHKYIKIP